MKHILITHNGIDIRKDENGFVCLNDLWHTAGRPANKKPNDWRRLSSVEELSAHHQTILETGKSRYQTQLEMGKNHTKVIYSIIGGGAATFAIRELALAYAGYLDIKLQALIYQAFLRKIDGVATTMTVPEAISRTFAGPAHRRTVKKVLAPDTENSAVYWQGYAAALEKMVLRLSGKEVAL